MGIMLPHGEGSNRTKEPEVFDEMCDRMLMQNETGICMKELCVLRS